MRGYLIELLRVRRYTGITLGFCPQGVEQFVREGREGYSFDGTIVRSSEGTMGLLRLLLFRGGYSSQHRCDEQLELLDTHHTFTLDSYRFPLLGV